MSDNIQKEKGEGADSVQLLVCASNLAEKCVIVRPQLVHMLTASLVKAPSITEIQIKCKGVHGAHVTQLPITLRAPHLIVAGGHSVTNGTSRCCGVKSYLEL